MNEIHETVEAVQPQKRGRGASIRTRLLRELEASEGSTYPDVIAARLRILNRLDQDESRRKDVQRVLSVESLRKQNDELTQKVTSLQAKVNLYQKTAPSIDMTQLNSLCAAELRVVIGLDCVSDDVKRRAQEMIEAYDGYRNAIQGDTPPERLDDAAEMLWSMNGRKRERVTTPTSISASAASRFDSSMPEINLEPVPRPDSRSDWLKSRA
jgi:hypothetical protein